MNDIRRTILWVVFALSIILLWDRWQEYNGRRATFFPAAPPPVQQANTPGMPQEAPADNELPAPSAFAEPPAAGSSQVPDGASAPESAAPRQTITVETDLLRLQFDSAGATLLRAELLQYTDAEDKTRPVVLFDHSSQRVYLGQSGLIGGNSGGNFPTHKTPMVLQDGARTLADGASELQLRFASPATGGVQLVKTWTLRRGSYAIAVEHEIINAGPDPVSPQLYLQLVRDGNKPGGENTMMYSTFTGPAIYTAAKKYQKVDFKDIENGKASIEKTAQEGYVAMVQHYFASAWILAEGAVRENFVRKVSNNLYAAGTITPLGEIAPGQSKTVAAQLFVGPQVETRLQTLSPGLELVKDYGWLTILAKPLYWLLDHLHSLLGNWGWSIVALVLLLKIAFYWLNAKAYASMAKMKALSPRIMEMRERLKDKPQQMQQEMMRIYREEKVNPMGGCLPIIVQIPVFIALYWVLLSSVEIRNAPWIGWISDLSARDPWFVLPLLMTLSSLLQTALNPVPPDPMQAKMMWFMPLAFSIMFFFFPAGLVLYWLTNNILSIAQQWIINKRMGVPPQFNLPKFGKKA